MAAAYEPPVSDAVGPLIIRPSWQAVGRWFVPVAAGVGMLLLGASLKLFGKSEKLSWIAVFAGLGGLFLAGYALYLTAYMFGTRIVVTADAILVTHWFWSTSRVDPRDIARVVRCSVQPPPTGSAPRVPKAAVFALAAGGRCVLSLYADRWRQADLDRIWRHLGVTPEGSWDDVVDDMDLDIRFPGAF